MILFQASVPSCSSKRPSARDPSQDKITLGASRGPDGLARVGMVPDSGQHGTSTFGQAAADGLMGATATRVLRFVLKRYVPTQTRHYLLKNRIWILREVSKPDTRYSIKASEQHGCIFFHIPKTGGLSVNQALFGNRGVGHIRIEQAQLVFGLRYFQESYKFAFVRNPWDRMVSAYRYLKRGGLHRRTTPWIEANILPFESFADFVRHADHDVVLRELHFQPQHRFICGHRGEIAVDFVGRFERLAADFAVVGARLGIDRTLPISNASHRADYRAFYDDETRTIVGNLYAKDVELFGYRFD